MVHQLRHRCPKGAATVEMNLPSPRHISTLLPLARLAPLRRSLSQFSRRLSIVMFRKRRDGLDTAGPLSL